MEDGRDGWWEKRGREGGREWHKILTYFFGRGDRASSEYYMTAS